MQQTLTLALILKNEADTVLDVIDSIPHDQLVVGIDSTSTDATRALVEPLIRARDVLFEFNFHDDFAGSRNKALEFCWGDFILFPDGHEVLHEESKAYLMRTLDSDSPVRDFDVFMPVIRLHQPDSMMPQSQSPRAILFRNHKGFHFEGRAHNYLTGYDHAKAVMLPEVIFDHGVSYQKLTERVLQRRRMNLEVFSDAVKADPKNLWAWFYLADTYVDLNDADKAIAAYNIYMQQFQKCGGSSEQAGQALIYLAHIYLFGREDLDAAYPIYQWASLMTPRAEPYFYMAWIQFKKGNALLALELLLRVDLARPASPYFLEEHVYNGGSVWELKGLCYNLLGEARAAADCFEQVLKLFPANVDCKENLEKLRAVCGV